MTANELLLDAAFHGDLAGVDSALAKGADIAHVGEDGWTALCWAASNGHVELVRHLLTAGADPNHAEPEEGESVLMIATQQSAGPHVAAIIDALVGAGAVVDQFDSLGWTALMHATTTNTIGAVEALLSHGADPDAVKDASSESPRQACKNPAIARLFDVK